jgi:hypothetical protein
MHIEERHPEGCGQTRVSESSPFLSMARHDQGLLSVSECLFMAGGEQRASTSPRYKGLCRVLKRATFYYGSPDCYAALEFACRIVIDKWHGSNREQASAPLGLTRLT